MAEKLVIIEDDLTLGQADLTDRLTTVSKGGIGRLTALAYVYKGGSWPIDQALLDECRAIRFADVEIVSEQPTPPAESGDDSGTGALDPLPVP